MKVLQLNTDFRIVIQATEAKYADTLRVHPMQILFMVRLRESLRYMIIQTTAEPEIQNKIPIVREQLNPDGGRIEFIIGNLRGSFQLALRNASVLHGW